ncbi:MAG: hypothetical protein FWD47_06100 [Treponema sp.]|nr:hypothetical protein [Treponema sp.]
MKKFIKLFGVIAFCAVMIISLTAASCFGGGEKGEGESSGGGLFSRLSGGGSGLVGSWKRDDGYVVKYSSNTVDMFDDKGSAIVKGSWSTKGDELTVTTTHFNGNLFGEAAPLFGMEVNKWYTMAELQKILESSPFGILADDFISIADGFSATGTYKIEGNRLTFNGPTGVIEKYTKM